MKRFIYAMTQRPPTPGAMPHDGLREIRSGSREMSARMGHTVYGILLYDRRLSPKEISDYELTDITDAETVRVV